MKKNGILVLTFLLLIGMFPQSAKAAQNNEFEQILAQYVQEISTERGDEVTKEDLEASLSFYELSFDDFEINSVTDLQDIFGEVLKADLSNLNEIYETYQLDEASLQQLLTENGDSLSDYIFLEDLSSAVYFYQEYSAIDQDPDSEEASIDYPDFKEEMLQEIFSQIGLTQEELQNLENYYTTLADYFSDQATLDQFVALGDQISALDDISITDELTEEQVAELSTILQNYFTLLKLQPVFLQIKDGSETQLSMSELMKLKELGNETIRVEFYGADSQLLADFSITKEVLDSIRSLVGDTTGEIVTEIEEATNTEILNSSSENQSQVKTVKGAKLPKTASNDLINALFGLSLVVAGILLYRKVRIKGHENTAPQSSQAEKR